MKFLFVFFSLGFLPFFFLENAALAETPLWEQDCLPKFQEVANAEGVPNLLTETLFTEQILKGISPKKREHLNPIAIEVGIQKLKGIALTSLQRTLFDKIENADFRAQIISALEDSGNVLPGIEKNEVPYTSFFTTLDGECYYNYVDMEKPEGFYVLLNGPEAHASICHMFKEYGLGMVENDKYDYYFAPPKMTYDRRNPINFYMTQQVTYKDYFPPNCQASSIFFYRGKMNGK